MNGKKENGIRHVYVYLCAGKRNDSADVDCLINVFNET